MPRTNETRVKANNSNRNFAPDSAKTVSYRKFEIEKERQKRGLLFHPIQRTFRSICRVLQYLSFKRPLQGLFRFSIV